MKPIHKITIHHKQEGKTYTFDVPEGEYILRNFESKDENGQIEQKPTVSKKRDFVLFKVLMNAVLCFSACPQDIVQINSGKPMDAHFQIID